MIWSASLKGNFDIKSALIDKVVILFTSMKELPVSDLIVLTSRAPSFVVAEVTTPFLSKLNLITSFILILFEGEELKYFIGYGLS